MKETDIRKALQDGSSYLTRAGAETPYLDACLLLAETLSLEKEQLFARLSDPLADTPHDQYQALLTQRAAGVPVSYLRKRKEFYGLEFYVDQRVLVPRPDTELIVETVLEVTDTLPHFDRIHDCCTGSGCIAVTLAKLHPGIEVSASDISEPALEVFAINSDRLLSRQLETYASNLLEAVPGTYHIIVSNPPYLLSSEVDTMQASGWPEPRLALDGGDDGLDLVRKLAVQSKSRLHQRGYLMLEVADPQMETTVAILEACGYGDIEVRHDLAGRRRVCIGRNGARS
ncbi:MAG: peptide chain release factor N(5)-glutamine methyltransferase [Spirochaetaceae bacterium]|nr:MAG: peptide chain release factor N(5)-glutamine methyltransferase [Spirochaetaceae bacterium]